MGLRRKQIRILFLLLLCILVYSAWTIYSSQNNLSNEDFIRFHVIANSDSSEDQQLKLKVRDGVLAKINSELVREAMAKSMSDYKDAGTDSNSSVASDELAVSTQSSRLSGSKEASDWEDSGPESEPGVNGTRVSLDLEQSRMYIRDNLKEIEKTAKRIINENGYDYDVKAELGVKWIPRKAYGEVIFPSGNYETLNITIGKGEGKNWWCVLFPPLCLIGVESDEEEQDAEEAQELYKEILLDHKYDPLMQEYDEPTTLKLRFKTLELLNKQRLPSTDSESETQAGSN